MNKKVFKIRNKIWLWPGDAAWHFVTIPPEIRSAIDKNYPKSKRGFGSRKVSVKIGKSIFKTSIFPEKKFQTYLLPIKKEIRKKENLQNGDILSFEIVIL